MDGREGKRASVPLATPVHKKGRRPSGGQGSPGGATSVCPCVLSSLWSDRNPVHSGFCLGPGADGRDLAPQDGLSGPEKVVSGSDFTFLRSILKFWWHTGKVDFRFFGGMPQIELTKNKQLYSIDVLKAWDYARTFFRSEKLHISYPKTDTGTKKTYFGYCLLITFVCASRL